MDSSKSLIKAKQKVARLQSKIALTSTLKRKIDTRNKIELGGLVIKSGLNKYPKSVILGALIDAVEQLSNSPDTKELFSIKGENAFMGFNEK